MFGLQIFKIWVSFTQNMSRRDIFQQNIFTSTWSHNTLSSNFSSLFNAGLSIFLSALTPLSLHTQHTASRISALFHHSYTLKLKILHRCSTWLVLSHATWIHMYIYLSLTPHATLFYFTASLFPFFFFQIKSNIQHPRDRHSNVCINCNSLSFDFMTFQMLAFHKELI